MQEQTIKPEPTTIGRNTHQGTIHQDCKSGLNQSASHFFAGIRAAAGGGFRCDGGFDCSEIFTLPVDPVLED
jgi:hypothetical protein